MLESALSNSVDSTTFRPFFLRSYSLDLPHTVAKTAFDEPDYGYHDIKNSSPLELRRLFVDYS